MKISVKIDVSKINKEKIVERKYTNSNGEEVTVKEYSFDVVPVNVPKFIREGDTWIQKKTHFVAEGQTKEERAVKAPTVFIGEGYTFENKSTPETQPKVESKPQKVYGKTEGVIDYPDEQINLDDIPF